MGYLEVAAAVVPLLVALYVWVTWHYDTFKKRGIPYVRPIPPLGSQPELFLGLSSMAHLSQDTYNSAPGKTVVGLFSFRMPLVMIRDPDVIKMVTTKDFDHFVDHFEFPGAQDDLLFGRNLFALKGARWKSMRNILSPAFTSSKMKSMFVLVSNCGKQLADHLEEKCTVESSGSTILDLRDLFTRFSNDVIATSAFGLKCDSLKDPKNEFYLIGKEAINFGGSRFVFIILAFCMPLLLKLLNIPLTSRRISDFFTSLVRDTMRTREREGIVRPDMIHLLMQARKGTLKDDDDPAEHPQHTGTKGTNLSDDDITAQAFLFFIAGLDSTSTLDCFLCHLLAVHPEVQRRVQDEIDAVLREDGGRLTYEGVVQRTKYLDMVISETLRLWPPVVELDRVCVKDYTIPATASTPAVEIKKGQFVSIPVFAIQRDPEFHPNPEQFDPERFNEERIKTFNHSAYLPFGTGPRACIGNRFALMGTKILAVSLLSRFNLEVTSKTPTVLRLKKSTLNTEVEGGFWLAITRRKTALH